MKKMNSSFEIIRGLFILLAVSMLIVSCAKPPAPVYMRREIQEPEPIEESEHFPPMPQLPPHNAPEIRQQPEVSFISKSKTINVGNIIVTSDFIQPSTKDLRENRREVENGKMLRFFYSPFKFSITVRNEMNHVFWIDGKTVVALEDDSKNMYQAKISRSWIAPNREEKFTLSFVLSEPQIKSTKLLRLHFYDLIVSTDVAADIKARQHATFKYGVQVIQQDTKSREIDCIVGNDAVVSPNEISDRFRRIKPFLYQCISDMQHSQRVQYALYVKPNKSLSIHGINARTGIQRNCLRKALFRLRPPKVTKIVAVNCGISKFDKPSEKIACSNDAQCPKNMFCSQESSPYVCEEKVISRQRPEKIEKKKKPVKKVKQYFDDE